MMHKHSKDHRSGAAILADALAGLAVRHVFHIPGEGMLELLDALVERHPDINLINFRHEGGMAYATEVAAHLTGMPGVCVVGRAPGALNAALAMHTAHTDAAPTIMIVGQAPLELAGREACDGFDLGQAFAPLVKKVLYATHAARLPELIQLAFQIARTGRQGPVVLMVPEDVLQQESQAADLKPAVAPEPAPSAAQLRALQEIMRQARRPLLLVGGSGWSEQDCVRLQRVARTLGWPVAAAYRRSDLFDNADPLYAGEIGIGIDRALAAHIDEADLILALNVRLGELNTLGAGVFRGYKLLQAPQPRQQLVHVHPGPEELQRVYQADLAINAGPAEMLEALDAIAAANAADAELDPAWAARLRESRHRFTNTGTSSGPVDLPQVFRQLRAALDHDAIVTVGAGAYAVWLHRYFSFHRPGTLFGPKSGAMGYGLPAAVGAALVSPQQRVVAFAGDGCFLMHGEELATAIQRQLRVLIIVINNQSYGAIRGAQQRMFGRSVGTDLANPDFAAYARAFGAHGEQIAHTEEFLPALERCLAIDGPSLIEIAVPKELGKPA